MKQLKEKHSILDCMYWNLFGLIPLLTASFAIAQYSIQWLVIYVIVFIGHFLIIEYKFFCTHCPHYCNDSETTNCMFLWFVPKFFKKKPGRLTKFEILLTILGFAIAIFFPTYWLIKSWQLFIVYFLSWAVLMITVKRYECCKCIYFHCPANTVDKNIRDAFMNRNL